MAREAFEKAGGRVVGVGVEEGPSPSVATVPEAVTFGELRLGKGVVRVLGGLLPQPTEKFDHEAGLEPHGVTYSGYQLAMNMTDWCRPDNARCGQPFGVKIASKDRFAPVTRFAKRRSQRFSRRRLVLRGTSRDRAPRGVLPRLARVEVAVGRRVGRRCVFLRASGRFGRPRSCARPTFVRAKGTARWSLTARRALPSGSYVAFARGVDRFGNRESTRAKRNRLRFRLR